MLRGIMVKVQVHYFVQSEMKNEASLRQTFYLDVNAKPAATSLKIITPYDVRNSPFLLFALVF
jgi:hypothetical protein